MSRRRAVAEDKPRRPYRAKRTTSDWIVEATDKKNKRHFFPVPVGQLPVAIAQFVALVKAGFTRLRVTNAA